MSSVIYVCVILAIGLSAFTMSFLFLNKKQGYISKFSFEIWFQTISFAAFLSYFILSSVKTFLGDGDKTLYASFLDIQFITIVHYSFIFILGMVAGVAVTLFMKHKGFLFMQLMNGLLCAASMIVIIFQYKMQMKNKIYILIYGMTFIVSMIIAKKSADDSDNIGLLREKKGFCGAMKQVLPINVFLCVTIAIYSPFELFMNNSIDFPISFLLFSTKMLFGAVLLFLVSLTIQMAFFSNIIFEIYQIIIFYMLGFGYIQGIMLNGKMAVLDGTMQEYSIRDSICNSIIWIVAFLLLVFLYMRKRDICKKLVNMCCVYLSLIQICSLGFMVLTTDIQSTNEEWVLTTDGLLEINESNNIFVFVLDKFDRSYIDEMIVESPDFLEPLHDFTDYQNATSEFCPTGSALPFLITGKTYQGSDTPEAYREYAFSERNTVLDFLNQQNYDIGVYTDSRYIAEEYKDIVNNYEKIKKNCNTWSLFRLMLQSSKYKMAPLVLKNYFHYDTSDIAQLVADDLRICNIEDDLPLYTSLKNKGLSLSANNYNGAYKLIHMHGVHPPFNMTEEFEHIEYDARRDEHIGDKMSQAKGALKIVYEYIEQLKELGKYDDSLIIITADHGNTTKIVLDGSDSSLSYPIMFVKEPFAASEQIQENLAPVSHEDISGTIMYLIDPSTQAKAISHWNENDERIRLFHRYEIEIDQYEHYQIDGNVQDADNWSKVVLD